MSMNIVLFIISSFIWGSTWFPIKLQLGVVTPIWSLAYRFGAAGFILLVYCLIGKLSLKFNRKDHLRIMLQSALLCFINYNLLYLSLNYLVSGIAATITASVIIMNIINGRILLKTPVSRKSVIGGVIGIIGVVCMIWSEFSGIKEESYMGIVTGLCLAFGGVFCASLGQIVLVDNLKRGLPIIQINALSFIYGSLFFMIGALAIGQMPAFDVSLPYILSLSYLSLIGTVCGFLIYFTLAKRIGLDKTGYVFIVTPMFAMIISSFVEDLIWTPSIVLGIIFVIIGNVLVMSKRRERKLVEEVSDLEAEIRIENR